MKVHLCFLSALFLSLEAKECCPRLASLIFLSKVAQPGAEVRVGDLGGSIMAQAGSRVKTGRISSSLGRKMNEFCFSRP